MDDIHIGDSITIPSSALRFQFSRSGGKGGQHVNKVSTKVELFFSVSDIRCSKKIKQRIANQLRPQLDSSGTLRIVSQSSRSQWQNKQTAIKKLIDAVETASVEQEERIATSPTKASVRRRIERKKREGRKKVERQKRILIE